MRAFSAWNSSSVSTPEALSSPSSRSWLSRSSCVAGGGAAAYSAGRGAANRAAQEQSQNEQIADLQAQQVAPPAEPAAPAAPAPAAAQDDRISQLRELGELKASGVLTDEEFQAEKARILGSS